MRKALILFSSLLLFFIPAASANHLACPEAGSLTLGATLSGSQFGGTGGSPNGFGTAWLTIDPATGQATVQMNVAGIGPGITEVTLTRIDGAVIGTFVDAEHQFHDGMLESTITLTDAQMQDILMHPTNYSLDVSTDHFPSGAIRGNLSSDLLLGGPLSGTRVAGADGAYVIRIVPDASAGEGNVLLQYDFLANGIGDQITGIELWDPAVGLGGDPILTLSNAATLTDGRLSGSIPISEDLAAQILANPGGYALQVNTAANPSGAIAGRMSLGANEIFLPVVASAHTGLNRWDTDLRLFNTSYDETATAMVEFFQNGWTSETPAQAVLVTIPPRGIRAFDNAMDTLFSMANGMGALRITSNVPIIATGRIFDDQRGAGRGTFGQTIAGLTACDAMSRAILTGLTSVYTGSSEHFQQRSNIGFFNPTSQSVMVLLELRNDAGTVVGTRTLTLQPFLQTQLSLTGSSGLFNELSSDLQNGTVSYEASAPIFVYGSVIDNTSGDANFLLPSEDLAVRP